MEDPLGVYVPGGQAVRQDNRLGALADVTLAVKDLFDVRGQAKTCGCPAWAARARPAGADAPAVGALMAAGCRLTGRTVLDELAYSLTGANPHYGTPANPNAPGRTPGGSSSGSAAAVAGGLADLALGTDTAGSVRVPAGYCGIPGFRPTHGAVSAEGVMPLAPSFDTVGWFARDAELLQGAGAQLLPPDATELPEDFGALLIPQDAWELADPGARTALEPWVERLRPRLDGGTSLQLGTVGGGLAAWRDVLRHVQAGEVWHEHAGWIAAAEPAFGPELAKRWAWVQTVSAAAVAEARQAMAAIRQHLRALTQGGRIIALPSAPGVAPPLAGDPESRQAHRTGVLALSCIASLGGLPQVSLPVTTLEGLPLGLGLIGPAGSDRRLLAFAARLLPGDPARDPGAVFD